MKALSIRQPWAWFIVNGFKNVENRIWRTDFRGEFLIHASAGCTFEEYHDAYVFAEQAAKILPRNFPNFPCFADLQRGGIVGKARLVDCVAASDSPWFTGPFGFVLADVQPLPFTPCKGMLKFFEVNL